MHNLQISFGWSKTDCIYDMPEGKNKMFQIPANLATTDKLQGFRGQLRFEVTFCNHLVSLFRQESGKADCPKSSLIRFWNSQGWIFPQPLWATCSIVWSYLPLNKAFSVLKLSFLYFSLLLLPLVLSLGPNGKYLALNTLPCSSILPS